MRFITISIVLVSVIFIGLLSVTSVLAGDEYVREVVFETHPYETPYRFRPVLGGQANIDFAFENDYQTWQDRNSISSNKPLLSPGLGYFWALNNDKLAFINRREAKIHILNLQTNTYDYLEPRIGKYNNLELIWVGPEDDIFVQLQQGMNFRSRKLFRFVREKNTYVYDDISDFPPEVNSSRRIRISPLNNLFVSDWHKTPNNATSVYTCTGKQMGITSGDGENLKGQDYMFSSKNNGKYSTVSVTNLSTNSPILFEETKRLFNGFNYKYTFDNSLIIYSHYKDKLNIGKDSTLYVNYPSIFGKNFDTNDHFLIDTAELGRNDHRYFTISDVSINYEGEIYAFAIYFDHAGRIYGDELIVLYKWSKRSEN